MKALIAIDGSAESGLAVETAANLSWPDGSVLEVMTVLPTDTELFGGPWGVGLAFAPTEDVRGGVHEARRQTIDQAVIRLERPGIAVVGRVAEGRTAQVIVETAREMGAELIILGARGHGLIAGAVLGSVSAEVVDQARCAVLVARRPTTHRILIGTDGSDVASSAVSFVGGSGLFRSAQMRVVHATDLRPEWWLGITPGDAAFAASAYTTVTTENHEHAEAVISAAAATLRSDGHAPSQAVLDGPAAAAIVKEATSWDADVVAVGTRGNGLVKRLLLGSTARSLLHHAEASVLIIHRRSTPVVTSSRVASTTPASPSLV